MNRLAAISNKKAGDAGMALVLVLLLVGYFTNNVLFYKVAIPVLVLVMAAPSLFKPFAYIWFGFAELLSRLVSTILLTIIFIVMVLPVALMRRLGGRDSLQLRAFKSGQKSVFVDRAYKCKARDLEKPY